MIVVGVVCMTLLSLLFQPDYIVSSHEKQATNQPSQLEPPVVAPGNDKLACYHWISKFDLNSHPEGIPVYRNSTGALAYSILPYPRHQLDRGFIITDSKNSTLLIAEDKKHIPVCGSKQTYTAFTSVDLLLTYKIDPRGFKTDRWYMSITGKDWNQTRFTYYRSRTQNHGTVKFTQEDKFAASFEYALMPIGNSKKMEQVVMLKIDPSVKADPSYFIGLWNLVKKRMHRCQM